MIKFRAWHKTANMMVNVDRIYFDEGYIESNEVNQPMLLEHVVMLPFTGEQDTLGVDIYEGDITRQVREDNNFGGPNLLSVESIGKHQYEELSDRNSGGPDGCEPILSIEVIGNIYQNPELLNETI